MEKHELVALLTVLIMNGRGQVAADDADIQEFMTLADRVYDLSKRAFKDVRTPIGSSNTPIVGTCFNLKHGTNPHCQTPSCSTWKRHEPKEVGTCQSLAHSRLIHPESKDCERWEAIKE